MYNVILFLKNRKAQYALSFFFLILLGVYGYIHATKGIDLTDEGMYVSTAMRFSMGDIPFRDEFMSALSQFNVLLAPVFWIFPEISLLQMRFAGIGLHVVSLFVLFLFLSRYAPPLLIALLCSTMFFVNNFYGIASPSYNSLASAFSLISLALWLFAIVSNNKSRRFFSSVLGGFFFSFAVFSYSSLIIVLVHIFILPLYLLEQLGLLSQLCLLLFSRAGYYLTLFKDFGWPQPRQDSGHMV